MNKLRSKLVLLAVSLGASSALSPGHASDQIPGGSQKKPVVFRNGVIHTVSGEIIENGTLVFDKGKIQSIGLNIAFPGEAEIIDAKGLHLYPGLIDSFSSIGLIEIDSIRASIDTTETGNINPNVRAAVAFNPDSEAIPVARANGVLISVITPNGGLVAGRSAAMVLDGWTWESMTLKPDVGMALTWPRYGRPRLRREGPSPEGDEPKQDTERLAALHELMRETKAYATSRDAAPADQPVDLRLEAMRDVVEGKTPVLVLANSVKQIQTSIAFAKQYSLKMILIGAADAAHCLQLIKEANIPVVVSSTYRLPTRHDSAYDEAYALPAKLREAGVTFCIAGDGRFGASMVRNLPYHAASASAFGLSEADALRSITLSAAEIFGIADRVGSLEAGKDATLIVTDGNILETPTQVVRAYIEGKQVDLTSKHTQLYQKYETKYKQ
jgi:imidazolonepropionase-like amidohydrolase